MRISWNWLSELVELKTVESPKRLAEILTQLGLEVESMNDLSQGFEKVISAEVLQKSKHPDADRLSVCVVNGGKKDPFRIVCGAQNFKQGDKVLLATEGAQLPNGMTIKKGKIRGEASEGMLCSAEELGLADSSDGIVVMPEDTPVGKPAAEVLGRQDTVFELGITPNRGDCLSHWGVAREVAAFTGAKLREPKFRSLDLKKKSKIQTAVDKGGEVSQFWGASIEGVQVGPSPQWVVQKLEAMGSRSINNVVDATNLVLFELGQPTHVYDADRLSGSILKADFSKQGEELPLLDGSTVKLTGEELVIADEEKAVALAGVMGGGNSEVLERSQNLYLECAEFDPVLVRHSSRRYVKHTDSSQRFERGIDPSGQARALGRLVELILSLAGGKLTGTSTALQSNRVKDASRFKRRSVSFSPEKLADFLGMKVSSAQIKKILQGLGCDCENTQSNKWKAWVPPHRWDLNLMEDLAEEVGRILGYDQIPSTLPVLTSAPDPSESNEATQRYCLLETAKDALRAQGLCETVQFSFNSQQYLSHFGLKASVAIQNPLSEDQEFLLPSLLPGMVQTSLQSLDRHFSSDPLALRVFQIRPTFSYEGETGPEGISAKSDRDTGIRETWKLALLMSGPRYAQALSADQANCDFFDLKAALEGFFSQMGTRGLRFQPLQEKLMGTPGPSTEAVEGLFHPGKSMRVYAGKNAIGAFGLLSPKISRRLRSKHKANFWVAELDWEAIQGLSRSSYRLPVFQPWSEQPLIERDFALLVKNEVSAQKVCQIASKAGKPLAKGVRIFDTYTGKPVPEGMTSIAVRVTFWEKDRSLQEAEADAVSAKILAQWKSQIGAELRN